MCAHPCCATSPPPAHPPPAHPQQQKAARRLQREGAVQQVDPDFGRKPCDLCRHAPMRWLGVWGLALWSWPYCLRCRLKKDPPAPAPVLPYTPASAARAAVLPRAAVCRHTACGHQWWCTCITPCYSSSFSCSGMKDTLIRCQMDASGQWRMVGGYGCPWHANGCWHA